MWEVDGGTLQNKYEDEYGNPINDLYISVPTVTNKISDSFSIINTNVSAGADKPVVIKTTMGADNHAQTEIKEYKTLVENTETKKSSVTVDKDGIALSHSDDEASIKLHTVTYPGYDDYKEIHVDTAAEIIDEKYNSYYAITSSNNDDDVLQASYGWINPTEDAFQIRTANAYVMRQRIAVHGGIKEFIPSEYITKLKEPIDQWDAKEVLDDVVILVQPNESDADLKYKLTSLDLSGFPFAGQQAYISKAGSGFRYAEYPVYEMQFQARNDFTAVFDSSIKWIGGKAPECKAGKTYEISILNGLGIWVEFE